MFVCPSNICIFNRKRRLGLIVFIKKRMNESTFALKHDVWIKRPIFMLREEPKYLPIFEDQLKQVKYNLLCLKIDRKYRYLLLTLKPINHYAYSCLNYPKLINVKYSEVIW